MNGTRYQANDLLDGRFKVYRAIRGGVGEVYLCVDEDIGKPLALKCLQPRYAAMPRLRQAFEREALTWISLGQHPNIVPCTVLQTIHDEPFLVLEWVFGPEGSDPDLGSRIRGRALDLRATLEIAIDVARGLNDAAKRVPGIVHRDLKPANILIGSDGKAMITDFGMAKSAAEAGIDPDQTAEPQQLNPAIGGTPRYMAPEQWTGAAIDARTDVYALACVLFEARRGYALYHGPTLEDFRRQHLSAKVPPSDAEAISEEAGFDAIVVRCLAKDARARPDPAELLASLTELYQTSFNKPPPVRPTEHAPTARDFNNRGVTMNALGHVDEAIVQFDRALELRPDYALARSNRAGALLSRERFPEALDELGRAIADAPSIAEPYVNRAAAHLIQDRPKEALADCNRAIAKNPKMIAAYDARARVHLHLGLVSEALADIDTALDIDSVNSAALLQQGRLRMQLDRPVDAIESFSRAIDLGGDTKMAYLDRALIYFNQPDDARAIEDLTRAIAQDSGFFPAYMLRGHSHGHLWEATGDPKWRRAAFDDYCKAIEIDPANSYAAYFERGKFLNDDYQEAAAIADFTRAIELKPDAVEAYLHRGRAHLDASQLKEAADDAVRILKIEPDNADASTMLGDALLRNGHPDKAVTCYERAIAANARQGDAYFGRAKALYEIDQPEEALRDIDQALALHPKWQKAWDLRSDINMGLGNSDAAAKDMAQAITAGMTLRTIPMSGAADGAMHNVNVGQTDDEPDPDATLPDIDLAPTAGTSGLRMRADMLFETGRYADAIAVFEQLVETGISSAEMFCRLGLARKREGDQAGAIRDYDRAIEIDPNFALAYNNRATVLRALGRLDEAIDDYGRAIALRPDYGMAYINRGGARAEAGDAEAGLVDLTRGIELEPDRPEGYTDRGRVYAKLDRLDLAISDLQRAVELNPDYAPTHHSLGALLIRRGDVTEALHALDRAAALGFTRAAEDAARVRAAELEDDQEET